MTTLTHRRSNDTLSNNVMLFAESGNEHYGEHVWTLVSNLPAACEDEKLIAFTMDWYSVDREEAIGLIDPANIVDTAGAWDDQQFVSYVWQALEPVGYTTQDGAVVLDQAGVELVYTCEE